MTDEGLRPVGPKRVAIDLEYVDDLRGRVAEVNSVDLAEVEFRHHGEPVEIPPGCLEEWRFVGMSNMAFFDLRYWLGRAEPGGAGGGGTT